MAWGLASSSPCDTRFDFLGSCIGGFRISGGHCGWAKSLKISVVGKSISKTNFEAKIFNFSSRAPRCTLTDRGHGGFAFFAHRHCPATQGSTFSARSARRVREKSTRSWPQISNRAKGSTWFYLLNKEKPLMRRMSGDAGFDFLCGCVACASEGSEFQVGTVAGRKIQAFPWSKKSISKTNIGVNIFNFSPPAPRCTFDRSGTLTPDVAIFLQRRHPEVWTLSPGPVFHPESFFDGPGAGKRPSEAENVDKPPVAIFLRRQDVRVSQWCFTGPFAPRFV